MTDLASLIAYVAGKTPEQAERILLAAETIGAEPLEFCAHRFGLGMHATWERAAEWAGLAFSAEAPASILVGDTPLRLDALARVRTCRARVFDREIVLAAPGAEQFVALRQSLERKPDLARKICVVEPRVLRTALAQKHGAALMDEARQRLVRRWPGSAADLDVSLTSRLIFIAVMLSLLGLVLAAPFAVRPYLFPFTALFLVVPGLIRLAAGVPGAVPPALDCGERLTDRELPTYTVLIPLRNEVTMVPSLARAMKALDYPPEKLDIKFVVEARSPATIAAVTRELYDPRFELIAVPDEHPRTKPKAINFALPFVRGEYLVVFDAEDIPEPGQLRLAAGLFASRPEIDCLQAELLVDNAGENWLTAMFAAEYAGQFGLMMPALSHWHLPMPLGGTSNHFSTRALRELGGWDAFNVTEDADLGVRLARLRYKVATFASHTREEAPITLKAWMAQRTRWMKGWMQTFIVHSRHPLVFISDAGGRSFLAFQIYVGSLILSALLHTAFAGVLMARVATGTPLFGEEFDIWDAISVAALIVGYGGALLLMIAGLLRLGRPQHLFYLPTLPLYWTLHSFATLRAAHELLVRPFFWAKTEHGRTKVDRSVTVLAGQAVPKH